MNNKKLLVINFFTLIAFIVVLTVGVTYSKPYGNNAQDEMKSVNEGLKVNSKRNSIVYKEDDKMLFLDEKEELEDNLEDELNVNGDKNEDIEMDDEASEETIGEEDSEDVRRSEQQGNSGIEPSSNSSSNPGKGNETDSSSNPGNSSSNGGNPGNGDNTEVEENTEDDDANNEENEEKTDNPEDNLENNDESNGTDNSEEYPENNVNDWDRIKRLEHKSKWLRSSLWSKHVTILKCFLISVHNLHVIYITVTVEMLLYN